MTSRLKWDPLTTASICPAALLAASCAHTPKQSGAQFTEETLEKWSTLVRIDAKGTTMERQASLGCFPEAFAPSALAGGYSTQKID